VIACHTVYLPDEIVSLAEAAHDCGSKVRCTARERHARYPQPLRVGSLPTPSHLFAHSVQEWSVGAQKCTVREIYPAVTPLLPQP
jgi:hypothetical protein